MEVFKCIAFIRSPSTRREWIEIYLPPAHEVLVLSPSTRREWIEIVLVYDMYNLLFVSLHTEGVD